MEQAICRMVADGKLHLSDVVIVSVVRSEGKEWRQTFARNNLPTLTTRNSSLWALSVGCVVEGLPDDERQVCRRIKNTERFTAQGFPANLVLKMSSKCAFKAAGNAYPVPLIIASLHPLLEAIGLSNIDFATWPPADLLSRSVPTCVGEALAALKLSLIHI